MTGPLSIQHCKCGASWLGYPWERCDWCVRRGDQAIAHFRKDLLQPEWLQDQGTRYWELDEVDRRIWNQTRGIPQGQHLSREWAKQLAQAVEDDLITLHEALGALRKWQRIRLTQWKNSSTSGKP